MTTRNFGRIKENDGKVMVAINMTLISAMRHCDNNKDSKRPLSFVLSAAAGSEMTPRCLWYKQLK